MNPRAVIIAALLMLAFHYTAAAATPQQATDDEVAVNRLIDRCIKVGGLKRAGETGPIELADPVKLSAEVASVRPVPSLGQRAALNARCLKAGGSEPGLVGLLKAVADESKDELTLGWALFWEGDIQRRRHEAPEAIASFESAAAHFAAAGSAADRGNCFAAIAIVYSQQGDSRSSLDYERKALEIYQAKFGPKSTEVATRLQSIAFVHANLGEKDQAKAAMEQSLAIFEASEGPKGPNSINALANIGDLNFIFRDFEKAAEIRARVVPLSIEVFGPKSLNHAAALEALADAEEARQLHPRAIGLYLETLDIRRGSEGARSLAFASTLRKLAKARSNAGDSRQAVEELTDALKILQAVEGERTAVVAEVIKDIARIRDIQGDHLIAIEGLRKALEIERSLLGDGHIGLALTHTQIGQAYQRIGELALALEHFREALTIVERIPGVDNAVVAVLGMISTVHLDLGQPTRAIEALERSLDLIRKSRGNADLEVSRVLVQLGSALMENRDFLGAQNRFDEALAIQKDRPGGDVDFARTLIRVGRVRQLQSHFAEAEAPYRQALEILRKSQGESGGETMLAKRALARLAFDQKQYARAAEAYLEVIETITKSGRDKGINLANDLKMLGTAYARSGSLEKSRESFQRAVAALLAAPTTGLPDSADTLLTTDATIAVLMAYGSEILAGPAAPPDPIRIREALQALRLAADVADRLRERLVLTPESKILIGERRTELFPTIIGLCSRLAALDGGDASLVAAFEAGERGAARVFLESLGRSRAASLGGVSADFLARESALSREMSQLEEQIGREQARPIARRDPKRVALLLEEQSRLREQRRQAVDRAEREFPAYAALKYPRPSTIQEARAVLADDEIALHFVVGEEKSFLIVIEKQPDSGSFGIGLHEIPPRAILARTVASLLVEKTLDDPRSFRRKSAEAFQMLIGPASASIMGKSLVIVPGGVLGNLPFELLVEDAGEQQGRYLVERHRVRYTPSMSALRMIALWERSRPPTTRTLWAIGDPIYDRSDPRYSGAPPVESTSAPTVPKDRFERLSQSGIEVDRIATRMGAGPEDRLLGSSATEDSVKKLSAEGTLATYRFVHFASHGILGEAEGSQPGLVLSLVGIPASQDGYLRLDEVAALKLNADLVVLSACQTGQGRDYRLEGVTGLARAFLYAGTRGVICSLWRVEDTMTSDFMGDFYTGLKSGKSAADALRAAQLKMIEADEPPLHWAPFVLIGR